MQTILIIGAGKGIGYEAVRYALASGYKVIAVSRDLQQLEKESDTNLEIIKADITIQDDINMLRNKINNGSYTISYSLITAGLLIKKKWQDFTPKEIFDIYNTNVFAVYEVIKAITPNMTSEEHAHIVTIGSMGGINGSLKFPGMMHYSSSKAALGCMTECFAEEFKETNLKINCLALGAVETAMKNQAFPDFEAPHTAKEMAQFVIHFLTTSGHYFNGKVLPVSISTP